MKSFFSFFSRAWTRWRPHHSWDDFLDLAIQSKDTSQISTALHHGAHFHRYRPNGETYLAYWIRQHALQPWSDVDSTVLIQSISHPFEIVRVFHETSLRDVRLIDLLIHYRQTGLLEMLLDRFPSSRFSLLKHPMQEESSLVKEQRIVHFNDALTTPNDIRSVAQKAFDCGDYLVFETVVSRIRLKDFEKHHAQWNALRQRVRSYPLYDRLLLKLEDQWEWGEISSLQTQHQKAAQQSQKNLQRIQKNAKKTRKGNTKIF